MPDGLVCGVLAARQAKGEEDRSAKTNANAGDDERFSHGEHDDGSHGSRQRAADENDSARADRRDVKSLWYAAERFK
jgi:hypothetical protein